MKKILLICALIVFTITSVYSDESDTQGATQTKAASQTARQPASVSVALGMDFFNYEEIFLSTGVLFNFPIAVGMEGCLGADFALWPLKDENSGEITPHFFIPINAGINFLFAKQKPAFLLGVGLTPIFLISPEAPATAEQLRFYMGPYVKGGLRVQVHEMMNWYIEIQQDLLIGAPYWINTATRIYTGINFKLAAPGR